MINLPANIRIYAYAAACDMRKQMDGLAGLVRQSMQRDPQSGDMYVFTNRRHDMLKVLFFDTQGFCLLAKRMDKGTFKLKPGSDVSILEINASQLAQLMRGLEIIGQSG